MINKLKLNNIFLLVLILFTFSCNEKTEYLRDAEVLHDLAEDYIRLGLNIGQYDPDFVDAYYGPDSLRPSNLKQAIIPKDSLLKETKDLQNRLGKVASSTVDDTLKKRAAWMISQLNAFSARIEIFTGTYKSFDEETLGLFGVKVPVLPESHFQELLVHLDSLLPGDGLIRERYQNLTNKFIIPPEKVDTVLKTAISESRNRTMEHIDLPEGENFTLELVNDKPWGGYNWYQGNYQSLIQINTDLPTSIFRAIDVGSHESYPGHHVYNFLLEKHLYREKGWPEISLYPLFSPQSLIAEGTANYGIDMAFPEQEMINFAKETLLPLAGLDTTDITLYLKAISIVNKLDFSRNEAGRGLLNGTMTEQEVIQWLMKYSLTTKEKAQKSISFMKKYRSYIINYNYGKELVKNYIESRGGTAENPTKRWEIFGWILSNQVLPSDLLATEIE
jgi:hypothetical protein